MNTRLLEERIKEVKHFHFNKIKTLQSKSVQVKDIQQKLNINKAINKHVDAMDTLQDAVDFLENRRRR